MTKDKGKGKEAKPPQRPRMLQSKRRRPRPNPKKLTLRPKMLLPLNQARKKTFFLQPRPRS